jgi:topoisomerase-4 subunit A
VKEIQHFCKFTPELVINAVHFDGHKGWTMVKRFRVETNKLKERFSFLTDHPKSKILFASVKENPRIKYTIKIKGKPMTGEVSIGEFMDVKGWKAVGNRLSDQMLTAVKEIELAESKLLPKPEAAPAAPSKQTSLFGEPEESETATPPTDEKPVSGDVGDKKTYRAGDTIEFD